MSAVTAALRRSNAPGSALVSLELKRARRNRRVLVFATVLPVLFFLTFSAGTGHVHYGRYSAVTYVMVSMATYACINALFSGGALIAAERAIGWPRQLRVAGLSSRWYVTTKVLIAYITALPGLIAVLVVGATVKNVQLPAGRWIGIAVSILLAALPIAALGVAFGYLVRPNSLQALLGFGSTLLALLGGLFVPVSVFPTAVLDVLKALPPYWAAYSGRSVLLGGWIGWEGVAVVVVWIVVLGSFAAWAFQRDSLRPASAGTT
jgi:ABC-2 type transport system permease protein